MSKEKMTIEKRIEAAGWGFFLVWLGFSGLQELGSGPALLGVGAIVLGAQAARLVSGLRLEGFWLLVGLGFGLAGLSELMSFELALLPILLLLAGTGLLASVATGGPRTDGAGRGSDGVLAPGRDGSASERL